MRPVPASRRLGDRGLPGAPVGLPPLRARVRDPVRLARGPGRARAAPAAAEYVAFVADALDVPVRLVGTGASRDAVLALQP